MDIVYINDKRNQNFVMNNQNQYLIRTLNLNTWNDGHIISNKNINPHLIKKINNWYFIILPDGSQITTLKMKNELKNLL